MPLESCEFCSKPAVFTVREDEQGVIRERHVCVKHARELDLPVGNYIFENKSYPSFASMAQAVAGEGRYDER